MKHRIIDKRISSIKDSQYEVEPHLNESDFQDYCDAAATCITYLKSIKKLKL